MRSKPVVTIFCGRTVHESAFTSRVLFGYQGFDPEYDQHKIGIMI